MLIEAYEAQDNLLERACEQQSDYIYIAEALSDTQKRYRNVKERLEGCIASLKKDLPDLYTFEFPTGLFRCLALQASLCANKINI